MISIFPFHFFVAEIFLPSKDVPLTSWRLFYQGSKSNILILDNGMNELMIVQHRYLKKRQIIYF